MSRTDLRRKTSRWPFMQVAVLAMALVAAAKIAGAQDASSITVEEASDPAPHFLTAQDSLSIQFPTSATNQLGWTIRVRVSSFQTADPMRVEIDFASRVGPVMADRNLQLRLLPIESGHSPPQSSLRVTLPLLIREGSERLRLVRHVPKSSFGNYYSVQLFEDGRAIANCKSVLGEPIADRGYAARENLAQQRAWRVLWVQSDADESTRSDSIELFALRKKIAPYDYADSPEQWREQISMGTLKNTQFDFATIALINLPAHWQSLVPFDAITIHGSDWQNLSTAQTLSAIAVRDWIHAGGVLIVRDAELAMDDSDQAAVGSTATPASIEEARQGALAAAERLEHLAAHESEMIGRDWSHIQLSPEQIEIWKSWFPEGAQQIRKSIEEYDVAIAASSAGVRAREELAGTIIFLGNQNGRPIQVLQWAAVMDRLGWRRSRLVRSGVDPILGSQRFFQWVIPGVTQPPVYTFMGLLGVFVILVGPVAYRKTAKAGRSYLMFAIAPLLAILTTVAMLTYSVLADGFGTRVRSRQITWVDGTSGDAVTRTRSTYFAAIEPTDGPVFPSDCVVTLFPDNQSKSWESRLDERFESRGIVLATGDELRLSRSFLPSRQQRQFVIQRPARAWGRIKISPGSQSDAANGAAAQRSEMITGSTGRRADKKEPVSAPESVEVRSETAVNLYELIVCDAQQRYFFVDKLSAGTAGRAQPISSAEASSRLGEMYKRQWLVSEAPNQRQNPGRSRSSYGETSDLLAEILAGIDGPEKPTEGIFEYQLQQRMQLRADLPANSFIALTDLNGEAIAIEGAEVSASLHYVMGSLP